MPPRAMLLSFMGAHKLMCETKFLYDPGLRSKAFESYTTARFSFENRAVFCHIQVVLLMFYT